MKATELSKYVIAKFDNVGDLITNKKLQKILFYIEAWSLVYIGSLIDEDFEAWIHGPVIPSVYKEYKDFGYNPIKMEYVEGSDSSSFIKEFESEKLLSSNLITLIDIVLKKYGPLSSRDLELLSHSELPWLEARKQLSPIDHCSEIINKNTIKDYYTSLVPK